MLRKILKYDLKSMFKFLIIFYVLAFVFAVLTRIFFSIDDSFIINIIGQICTGATISMICSMLINNMMRFWVIFKNSFYKDESYLIHTLPISKSTLYKSKYITSIVTLFISVVVIGITLFVAYYSKDNIEMLKNMLLPVADVYGSTIFKILIAFLLVFFVEFANLLQSGIIGIILGNRMYNNKNLFSVLFGFGFYTATQIFVLLSMFIVGIFNKDVMNLFYTTESVSVDMIKFVICFAIIIYTISLVIGYIVGLKLFNKGVNVD